MAPKPHKKQSFINSEDYKFQSMGLFFSSSTLPPLVTVPALSSKTSGIMGTWFVIGVKPTFLETTCSNAVETYTRTNAGSDHDIDIDFQYNKAEAITSPLKSMGQRGWIQGDDKEQSSKWKISPFGCIRMPYPIIELDDSSDKYEWIVVGHEGRQYAWIMARKPIMDDALYNSLTQRLVDKHQYGLDGMRKVPQKWTKEERTKRNLENLIPDDLLVN